MPLFDFSQPLSFDLGEVGARLISQPAGQREVNVELREGDLFIGAKRVIAYIPAKQALFPGSTDVNDLINFWEGLPLVHQSLAEVLHRFPDLIPPSLVSEFEMGQGSGGGIIFPNVKVQTFGNQLAVVSMFTLGGVPNFCYPIQDRLPRLRACLLEVG